MNPIPEHLKTLDWYAKHQAWLKHRGLVCHDPGGASPSRAYLRGAYLGGANLGGADLRDAYLRGAYLRDANLGGADLGEIDIPIIDNIDAAILSAIRQDGCSLDMGEWHKCETTHCRAGWAIHLAGERGRALEEKTTPYLAGRLIYEASRPGVPCPDFFASTEDAMADIEKCAALPPKGTP